MRLPLILCAAIVATPGFAATPSCALPAADPIPASDQTPTSPVSAQAAPPQTTSIAEKPNTPPPVALSVLPFVQHIAAAGAAVSDLGVSHGMRLIAARSGDQFMVFQVTPDGQAAVSGAMTDLTPQQLDLIAAGNITKLGDEHGLAGYFVRSGAQFQVFYATPDKARLIPGVLWDASGKDLTREQVSGVPGAIPTVVVGGGDPAKPGSPAPALAALPLMRRATFGTIGRASAPHLWMLIDPQCVYSVRAMQMLRPYVASGRLQLSVIPLALLDYEDQGQSTKSALALLSKPADQIIAAWQAGSVNNAPSPEATDRLRANMAIAQAIHLRGTPTLVWRKADGTEGRMNGLPGNADALVASIGS